MSLPTVRVIAVAHRHDGADSYGPVVRRRTRCSQKGDTARTRPSRRYISTYSARTRKGCARMSTTRWNRQILNASGCLFLARRPRPTDAFADTARDRPQPVAATASAVIMTHGMSGGNATRKTRRGQAACRTSLVPSRRAEPPRGDSPGWRLAAYYVIPGTLSAARVLAAGASMPPLMDLEEQVADQTTPPRLDLEDHTSAASSPSR